MLKFDEIIKILDHLNYSEEDKSAIKNIVSIFYDFENYLRNKLELSEEGLQAFFNAHLAQYKNDFKKEVDTILDSNLSMDEEIDKNSNLAIKPMQDLCIKYEYPRTNELLAIVKTLYTTFIKKEYEDLTANVLNDLYDKNKVN